MQQSLGRILYGKAAFPFPISQCDKMCLKVSNIAFLKPLQNNRFGVVL